MSDSDAGREAEREQEDMRLLEFFEHGTLLFEEMREFRTKALEMVANRPPGMERTVALRELLRDKDTELLKVLFS